MEISSKKIVYVLRHHRFKLNFTVYSEDYAEIYLEKNGFPVRHFELETRRGHLIPKTPTQVKNVSYNLILEYLKEI